MLTPITAAFFLLVSRYRPWMALGLVTCVCVAIETLQWLLATGRSVDIDDVLLNTLGAWAVYLLLSRYADSLRGWATACRRASE